MTPAEKIKIGTLVEAKEAYTNVNVSGTFQGYRLEDIEDPLSVFGLVLEVRNEMTTLRRVTVDSIEVQESIEKKGNTWVKWRSNKDNPKSGKYIIVRARGEVNVGLHIGYDNYVLLRAEVVKGHYIQSCVINDTFMEGHEWMYLDALKQKPLRSDSPFFLGGQIDKTKIK